MLFGGQHQLFPPPPVRLFVHPLPSSPILPHPPPSSAILRPLPCKILPKMTKNCKILQISAEIFEKFSRSAQHFSKNFHLSDKLLHIFCDFRAGGWRRRAEDGGGGRRMAEDGGGGRRMAEEVGKKSKKNPIFCIFL